MQGEPQAQQMRLATDGYVDPAAANVWAETIDTKDFIAGSYWPGCFITVPQWMKSVKLSAVRARIGEIPDATGTLTRGLAYALKVTATWAAVTGSHLDDGSSWMPADEATTLRKSINKCEAARHGSVMRPRSTCSADNTCQ